MTLQLHTRTVDPRTLKLLDLNAHYMPAEMYRRLVENIKRDGVLTSTPLCWELHDDTTRTPQVDDDGQPFLEVLSGNHRVQAAIDAGLATIEVQVILGYHDPARRIAVQLSHNSIFGQDDPAILKILYESIPTVEDRVYSGVDDKTIALLEPTKIQPLSEAAFGFQTVSLVFLPDERDAAREAFALAAQLVAGNEAWLARWTDYGRYLDALDISRATFDVKNVAVALHLILQFFLARAGDLAEHVFNADGDLKDGLPLVSLPVLLRASDLKAKDAAVLQKAIKTLIARADIDPDRPVDALVKLAQHYLNTKAAER